MEKFNLIELNELYYCVGRVRNDEGMKLVEDKSLDVLLEKLMKMIEDEVKNNWK
jgi:hypothetical protein